MNEGLIMKILCHENLELYGMPMLVSKPDHLNREVRSDLEWWLISITYVSDRFATYLMY